MSGFLERLADALEQAVRDFDQHADTNRTFPLWRAHFAADARSIRLLAQTFTETPEALNEVIDA